MSEILSRLSIALTSKPLELGPFERLLKDLSKAAEEQFSGTEPAWDDLIARYDGEIPDAPQLPLESQLPVEIDSHALMQGRRMVVIKHRGELYRLMETRNAKLILQK